MKKVIPYGVRYLLLSAFFYLLSFYSYHAANKEPDLQKIADQVEQELRTRLNAMDQALADKAFIQALLSGEYEEALIKKWNSKFFIYGLFEEDSLIWWSRYDVDIPSVLRFAKEKEPLARLANGYYKVRSKPYRYTEKDYFAVGLLPIKYAYPVENQYLKNELTLADLPDRVYFSPTLPQNALQTVRIRGKDGETLFYLYTRDEAYTPEVPGFSAWLVIVAFIFLLSFLWVFLSYILSPWPGHMRFLLYLPVVIFCTYMGVPAFLRNSELFGPAIYASSSWAPSLGHLLIYVLAFWAIVYFLTRHVHVRFTKNKVSNFLLSTLLLLLLFAAQGSLYFFIQTLITDSNISFDLSELLRANVYSWTVILMMALYLQAIILLSVWLVKEAIKPFHIFSEIILTIVAALILFFFLEERWLPVKDIFILIGFSLLFIFSNLYFLRRRKVKRFYLILFSILYAAIFSGFYFQHFIEKKELESQQLFANLLLQPDYQTEYLFGEVRNEIVSDPLVIGYFRKEEGISARDLEDEINYVYLKGELSKYDVKVFAIPEDSLQLSEQIKSYYQLIDREGQVSSVPGFYYFPKSPGKVEYLAILRVYDQPENQSGARLLGRLVIEFRSKSIGGSTVYPELLLDQGKLPRQNADQYDYAIYRNGLLVKKSGDYPYPVRLVEAPSRHSWKESDQYRHLIYTENPEELIWITRPVLSFRQKISFISILVFIYSLAYLVFASLLMLFRDPKAFLQLVLLKKASFALRIQVAVTGIILLSFIIIAAVVIRNIRAQYDLYHRQRLIRKSGQILANLEYLKNRSKAHDISWDEFLKSGRLRVNLSSLSEVHTMDFNLYGKDAYLAGSSQPAVFKRGILSHLMHPVGRFEIYKKLDSQYLQNEEICRLKFIAAYIPLLNGENEVVGTLNVPYFAKARNLDQQISEFLIYFINVYVILLAIAGILGFIISRSISLPIIQLGQHIGRVHLGARNQPLTWKREDEIGRLVEEYNTMIAELEESARKLAQTERESAWREMARQVAHEIKNPLTPMKLSIQHLQRTAAQLEGEEGERVYRVCGTLLEQIEQLSHIATEFSSFAHMPRAQNERINLVNVVKSVYDLYGGAGQGMHFKTESDNLPVYADEKQLNRVFQNLIKNALESIPEDRDKNVDISIRKVKRKDRDFVEVTISDNGIGISEEMLNNIFRPNFTTKSTGTGLGLPISQRIIRNAGGDITVESEPGKGSVFHVFLPLATEDIKPD